MLPIAERIRHYSNFMGLKHQRVAAGFLWVGLFALSGRLAGAAKEITIAWRYGVSETIDAYIFIFNMVSWPVAVWSSILTVVLIPLAAKIRRDYNAEMPLFQRELVGLTLVVGVLLSLLYFYGLPILLKSNLSGLSGAALIIASSMAGPFIILIPTGILIGLCSTWLMASGKHRNTLLEAVPAITIMLALLMPVAMSQEPLILGTIIGLLLQLIALAWPLRGTGALGIPRFSFSSSVWIDFRGAFGLMAVGQVLMSLTTMIDQFFATHLGIGALSTLSYANRILGLILSVVAISIARAILPVLAESRANGEIDVDEFGLKWATIIFVFGIVLTAFIWMGAPWLVEVILERGAFTVENTKEVSALMKLSALQLPFFCFSVALAQVHTSDARWMILLTSGVIGICMKIISAYFLTPTLAAQGLALSNFFVYLGNSIFFLFIIKWKPIK